mmetsp:Transcript_42205/g.134016  ORF Transcript_42205/g.134016 Transcript_42205/m.134016 type:complete len:208 (-) Transcript_42205:873-1496(-)
MPLERSSRRFTAVLILSASSGGMPHCLVSRRRSEVLCTRQRAKTPRGLERLMPPRPSSRPPRSTVPPASAPAATAPPAPAVPSGACGSGRMVLLAPPPPPPPGLPSSSGWCSGLALRSSSINAWFSESMEFMYGKQRTVRSLQDTFKVLRYLLTHMSWKRCETPLSSHRFSLRFSTWQVRFSAMCAPRCMHPFAWIWLSLRSSVWMQ